MKIYRRPFYKSLIIVPIVVMLLFFIVVFPSLVNNFNAALSNGVSLEYLIQISIPLLMLYISVFTFILVYPNFYIVISNSEMTIVNGIIPFIKKTFYWDQIIRCEIGNKGGLSYNYFRVICNNNVKSMFYVIEMVPVKDYDELIKDIKSRNIEIEIVGHLKK